MKERLHGSQSVSIFSNSSNLDSIYIHTADTAIYTLDHNKMGAIKTGSVVSSNIVDSLFIETQCPM